MGGGALRGEGGVGALGGRRATLARSEPEHGVLLRTGGESRAALRFLLTHPTAVTARQPIDPPRRVRPTSLLRPPWRRGASQARRGGDARPRAGTTAYGTRFAAAAACAGPTAGPQPTGDGRGCPEVGALRPGLRPAPISRPASVHEASGPRAWMAARARWGHAFACCPAAWHASRNLAQMGGVRGRRGWRGGPAGWPALE